MTSKPPEDPGLDQALADAMAHPIRGKVLVTLVESPDSSAQQVASRMGEKVDRVRYHLRELSKAGLIESSGKQARRGVLEYFYRPLRRPFIGNEAFAELDDSSQWRISVEIVKSIFADASRALAQRTIHKRGGHLTRVRVRVDAPGWEELLAVHKAAFEEVDRVKAEIEDRLTQGDEESFWVTSGLMCFECAPPGPG